MTTDPEVRPHSIDSVATLLAHAHALESEAAERYHELSGQMEMHNNSELAALFRKMAAIEEKHVVKVDGLAEAFELQRLAPWHYHWSDPEGPETTPFDKTHYRMSPHHALRLALTNEERAVAFFVGVAERTNDADVRSMAMELAEEERHHVTLIAEWLSRYPPPDSDWEKDLDEPVDQE